MGTNSNYANRHDVYGSNCIYCKSSQSSVNIRNIIFVTNRNYCKQTNILLSTHTYAHVHSSDHNYGCDCARRAHISASLFQFCFLILRNSRACAPFTYYLPPHRIFVCVHFARVNVNAHSIKNF